MLYESMETAKKMRYILNMSPVLNKDAMFSDGTEYYRTPVEPREGDTVTIQVFVPREITWTTSVLCMTENIWK